MEDTGPAQGPARPSRAVRPVTLRPVILAANQELRAAGFLPCDRREERTETPQAFLTWRVRFRKLLGRKLPTDREDGREDRSTGREGGREGGREAGEEGRKEGRESSQLNEYLADE